MEFKELGLSEPVMESLHRLGFTTPTPIQEQAIPPLLQGRDLMGRAETGSGKTLSFGLPLIERVEAGRVSIQALVVCPTRELAQQVADDLIEVGKEKGVKVALVVGGVHVRTQRLQIPGKQVVVGTPGRIIDLLTDRFLPVEWVEYFVLDEFDRLLDMGFLDDIKRIVKRLPRERQTALFSATVPKLILKEAATLLTNPVQIQIGSARRAVDTIEQRAIRTSSAKKLAIVEHILKEELDNDGSVVIFCNTKRAVRLVDRELWAKNFSVAALSGDHEQSVRFKVMERFRNREIRVLVATDVAARGLDIDHIGHVINFDVPFETEDYVHRIGRTGRAGRDGVVTTLIGNDDFQKFEKIRKHIEQNIEMLSERCEPLQKPKKQEPSRDRTPAQDDQRESKPQEQSAQDPAQAKISERPPEDSALSQEESSEERERRPRRRRRRARNTEDSRDSNTEATAETSKKEAPSKDAQKSENDQSDKNDGENRPNRNRSRGRGRGRSRRDRDSDKAPESAEAKAKDKDKPAAKEETQERKPSERRGRGRRNQRDGERSSRPRADKQAPSSSEKPEQSEKTEKNSRNNDRSARKDRKPQERGGRGRTGRGGDRKGGRRSQSDHERWEREQLDRPVDLIEDNWSSVDNFSSSDKKKNQNQDDRGRGQENDNAPAPFEESDSERAAIAGSGARKKVARRRGQAQKKKRDAEPRESKPEAKKPEPEKNNDIVW